MVYAVNITKKGKKRPNMRGALRELFYAARGACSYCRRKTEMPSILPNTKHELTATIDHHLPISRGGAMRGENAVLACALCNGLKGSMMPDEWQFFMDANPMWWLKHRWKPRKRLRSVPARAAAARMVLLGGYWIEK